MELRVRLEHLEHPASLHNSTEHDLGESTVTQKILMASFQALTKAAGRGFGAWGANPEPHKISSCLTCLAYRYAAGPFPILQKCLNSSTIHSVIT